MNGTLFLYSFSADLKEFLFTDLGFMIHLTLYIMLSWILSSPGQFQYPWETDKASAMASGCPDRECDRMIDASSCKSLSCIICS